MTREEAIEKIKDIKSLVEKYDDVVALRMAIEALKQEQEPCEDAVSRELKIGDEIYIRANVNEIRKDYIICENAGGYFGTVLEEIKSSVTPTQKWIPVKERLPEESLNSVIGWDAYRERCVFVQYIDGYFQITGRDESFNITAWMPLPEPYVPDTNDGNMEETLSYADQDTMQPAT